MTLSMKEKCKRCGYTVGIEDGYCKLCRDNKEQLKNVDWTMVNLITGREPAKIPLIHYQPEFVIEK